MHRDYTAPYKAALQFDQSELHSLLSDIRGGRVSGAISTLQAVADRSGGDAAELFSRARFDPRSKAVAA